MDNYKDIKTIYFLLCKHMGVVATDEKFRHFTEHPRFPSFEPFYYFLRQYGVDSIFVQIPLEELKSYPIPMIVYVNEMGGVYRLIDNISEEKIYYKDIDGCKKSYNYNYFQKIWNNQAFIIDLETLSSGQESWIIKLKEYYSDLKYYLGGAILGFSILGYLISDWQQRSLFNVLFLICYAGGIFISCFFLLREFDEKNIFVNRVCHSRRSKNIDCNSILDSKSANFMSLFSWSDLGFVYFTSLFLILLFFPVTISDGLAVIMSYLAFPYIFYSIYYQVWVAKKLCRLCFGVLVILFLLSFIALLGSKYLNVLGLFTWGWAWRFASISFLVTIFYSISKPIIHRSLKYLTLRTKFILLKHDPEVLQLLFEKQLEINTSMLEKIILSPEGKDCITIIFNTTCNPCIRELRKLMRIYQSKENTRIEFIFLLSSDKSDYSWNVAKYFLHIYYQQPDLIRSVVSDYIEHYPGKIKEIKVSNITDEENHQLETIICKQTSWCITNKLMVTPLLFWNYKYVPDVYLPDDLDYMCN